MVYSSDFSSILIRVQNFNRFIVFSKLKKFNRLKIFIINQSWSNKDRIFVQKVGILRIHSF